jgi:hypothetical protein
LGSFVLSLIPCPSDLVEFLLPSFVGEVTVLEWVEILLFDLGNVKVSLSQVPNVNLVSDDFLSVESALFLTEALLNSAPLTDEGENWFGF